MNRCSGSGIRENTVASFIAARDAGASWVEFDVQVTRDGVPVLWHDDGMLVKRGVGEVESHRIRDLTLAEIKALSRDAMATAARTREEEANRNIMPDRCSGSENRSQPLERSSSTEYSEISQTHVVFYRRFPVGYGSVRAPEPEPWVMDIEGPITTLEELFNDAPKSLGFSAELKFNASNPADEETMRGDLGAILAVCRAHPTRRMMFSSFDPDAACIMRELQDHYPVMMLSDCDAGATDPRRRSVAAAVDVALDNRLSGLVLNVNVLSSNGGNKAMDPTARSIADDVRGKGLYLGTYGKANDDAEFVVRQAEWGASYVCTDAVGRVTREFHDSPAAAALRVSRPSSPTMSDHGHGHGRSSRRQRPRSAPSSRHQHHRETSRRAEAAARRAVVELALEISSAAASAAAETVSAGGGVSLKALARGRKVAAGGVGGGHGRASMRGRSQSIVVARGRRGMLGTIMDEGVEGAKADASSSSSSSSCPCGSSSPYVSCCGALHENGGGEPSAIVRARFSAYVKNIPQYVVDSTHPESGDLRRVDATAEVPDAGRERLLRDAKRTMSSVTFKSLRIRDVADGAGEHEKFVTYEVAYKASGKKNRGGAKTLAERSRYRLVAETGEWRFVDATPLNSNEL